MKSHREKETGGAWKWDRRREDEEEREEHAGGRKECRE